MAKGTRTNQGSKQLKPRQMVLVKNLMDGMTLTEAARRAGYSKKWPGQAGYQVLQSLKLKMPDLLERLGLGPVVLIEKYLKPQLDAKMVKYFQHEGKVTDERIVPDNDARLKALDMTFKLGGSYAPTDPKPEYPIGVKVIMVDIPRPGDRDLPQLPCPDTRS